MAKLDLIIALIRVLEIMIGERLENGVILDRYNTAVEKRIVPLQKFNRPALSSHKALNFETIRDFVYGIQRTNLVHRDALPKGADSTD